MFKIFPSVFINHIYDQASFVASHYTAMVQEKTFAWFCNKPILKGEHMQIGCSLNIKANMCTLTTSIITIGGHMTSFVVISSFLNNILWIQDTSVMCLL